MKSIKKSTWIVIICAIAFAVMVAVFAVFNADDIKAKRDLETSAEFIIQLNDTQQHVTMQDMLDLGPVEFSATMDTSVTDPTPVTFTGVELKKIYENFGLDISSVEVFEVRALDGYSSALTLDEVLADGNVYICIMMNGEALKAKSEGGYGPYMMVINSSEFSQRWCKFVQEIETK